MTAPISESVIRQQTTDQSFDRGEDYYRRGAVSRIVQRSNTIHADVEGSEVRPYRVSLEFDAGGVTAARCTCPYDWDGWCKHIVATALVWMRDPDRVELRPTLTQLLERLDQRQTQQLVQALVAEQPELIDAIEDQAMQLAHPAPSQRGRSPKRRSTLDVAPIRRQVKQILREGVRYLEEGYEEDPFSEELSSVIEKAQEFAQNQDGASAIAILEAITATCADESEDISSYGGDLFPIADLLNEAWTEAILSAELSSPEAVDLRVMLADWQETLDTDFSMSLAALDQGWADPDLQRAMQGYGYSDPERLEMPFARDLALIRLQILDRQERQQEYLHLAQAEGLMRQYLTRLAELGQINEAMSTARSQMTTAEEAFALAQTLRASDHLAEALAIAEAGLPLPGRDRVTLATWTSELAAGLGNPALALDAAILAFQLRPSLADYQRIAQLAAHPAIDQPDQQWDAVKPELLTTLRQLQEWESRDAKVDIFLYEGLIAEAIQAVESDTYYRSELVHRVMQAAVSQRPEWVIAAARSRAEPILAQGKADRYQEAVNWLLHVKAAYLQSDQGAAWRADFEQLQSIHIRKRKLMELFKQLR